MSKTGCELVAGPGGRRDVIAYFALAGIGLSLALRFGWKASGQLYGMAYYDLPLVAVLALGGVPLVVDLARKLVRREFGSDLLAGTSIVVSAMLGEYLAGALVVLMLSGGEALEAYTVRSASSALEAMAQRMPSVAHRKQVGAVRDISLDQVSIGDTLVVFPHEICPVDGSVIEGQGSMDESYLTGEPYVVSKTPGASVLSGAINGSTALGIRAEKLPVDSRYAKIMQVMKASELRRPRLQRIGNVLGAIYTPLAILMALMAWSASGEVNRFLAVLVVATPCPLLIAIPVATIGSISLAARRGIIIKDAAVLESVDVCRTAIFDKTGTLTYGRPQLTRLLPSASWTESKVLPLVASLERYSKHPLSSAILGAAAKAGFALCDASEVSELPGEGLRGVVEGQTILVTSRHKYTAGRPDLLADLPPAAEGLECVVVIDGAYAATLQFRDAPRTESPFFIRHLRPQHHFDRLLLVSGDRESEVRYLADQLGIREVYASQSPEQKLEIVREETRRAKTLFLGDGINDAPAMTAASVGIAFGQNSDIAAQSAGAVILESSLRKVDELLHIGRRMRSIALQSAVGGMTLSLAGMAFAATGHLPPVAGALVQELIDVIAVLNALRVAFPPTTLSDEPDSPADAGRVLGAAAPAGDHELSLAGRSPGEGGLPR